MSIGKTRKIQLQCPMPQLDFDVITLGHGGGGQLTNELLDKAIFELFNNDKLDTRHDGAILSLTNKMAFSTDSFVISPIFFPGGSIGELAVNGTVNDIAMCGALPKYISLALIIEEGLPMTELWDILVQVKAAADRADVLVVTGDTKVVERGKGDKIFINTTGIGEIHQNADISTKRIEEGDKIIISGNIATHGMAIMSVRKGLEFETSIESDTCNLNHTIKNLLDEFGTDIHLMRDPTRGGVASTLNEIARDINRGINLHQNNIPIDSRVENACEILGLDPLYVANEGVFVVFVKANRAEAFVDKLRQFEEGKDAVIAGEVVDEHPKKVLLISQLGGKRVVNMQVGEQLPRIC